MGSSASHVNVVGIRLRYRARHRGCVVPLHSESDSPVHYSRYLFGASFLLIGLHARKLIAFRDAWDKTHPLPNEKRSEES